MLDMITRKIIDGSLEGKTDFLYKAYMDYISSQEYKDMITANDYYNFKHDILKSSRWKSGRKPNYPLPDEKIIDNQYAKMVDQKNNYLLSKPFKIDTGDSNEKYIKEVENMFGFRFRKMLKNIGRDSINIKYGYLYAHRDESGELQFKKFNPLNIITFFTDEDKEELDAFIRFYDFEEYKDGQTKTVTILEFYNKINKEVYRIDGNKLVLEYIEPYTKYGDNSYTWDNRIPLFVFKSSSNPMPLLNRCKSLQDGINTILSTFGNNMQEDARNTVIVIKNYDGQPTDELRGIISETGIIKISTRDAIDGSVEALNIEVNAENYESILKILKKALIENCKGFDAKDDRISGSNFNQMNIQSMYNDIELDAADMELEFQTTLEELVEFVNEALGIDGEVKFTFNRNVMMNTSQIIEDLNNSNVSLRTKLEKDPYCDDVEEELKRLEEEAQEELERYNDYDNRPFNNSLNNEPKEGDNDE